MKTRLYTLFVALTVLALLGSQWKAESFAASVQEPSESENEREALTDDEGQEERSSEFEDEFDFDEEEGFEDESEEEQIAVLVHRLTVETVILGIL